MRRSNRFGSRLPAYMVATGLAVLASYFLFFRSARPPQAEASPVPAPLATPAPAVDLPELPPPAPPVAPPEPQQDPAPAPAPEPSVDQLIAAEKILEARDEIGRRFAGDLTDERRSELAAKAVALHQRLLVTQPDPREVDVVEIAPGENPTSFSRRFKQLHGEYGVIQLVNNIRNASAVRAGTKLRVPKGEWSILVDKSLFALYLCYRNAPYKIYRCCIGADNRTPAAKFVVGIKNPKPQWYAPADWLEKEKLRNPIPYGHAKNPLGEYWIGIDNPLYAGFGIHGTNAPDTIGTKASQGCVRLLNEDVLELARVVWKGMDVTIVE